MKGCNKAYIFYYAIIITGKLKYFLSCEETQYFLNISAGSKSEGVESYDARIRPTSVNMLTNQTGEKMFQTEENISGLWL